MTKLLEKAFAAVSQLPEAEQDTLAERLLENLEFETKWDASFEQSSDTLATLAKQAVKEFRAGATLPQLDDADDLAHD